MGSWQGKLLAVGSKLPIAYSENQKTRVQAACHFSY
tara:strand:+ start:602 stop:709 length:108 start_codon:yes stop_codon:yes gene_type:complete